MTKIQKEQDRDIRTGEVTQYICVSDLDRKIEDAVETVTDRAVGQIRNYFQKQPLGFAYGYISNPHKRKINAKNLDEYVDSLFSEDGELDEWLIIFITGKDSYEWTDDIIQALIDKDPYLLENESYVDRRFLASILEQEDTSLEVDQRIRETFPRKYVWKLLKKNPNLWQVFREYNKREKKKRNLGSAILDRIPEKVTELYPAARTMNRHFILHLGGTNSGKTYSALEALKEADTGVYLAPLRLLAYEVYEKLNREDYPCSLLTGEESAPVEGACFIASTMEMADFDQQYEIAVIDEAQMVEDESRGGAWTSAILGILADTVHVCASPNAREILVRMIEECGDTCEIVYHERKTPLLVDETSFQFPSGVRKGDALIVFSRRNVHAVAAELQGKGYKCAVIYGALPYDVRHRQAELFATGKMDVVVATDAIGMGMNLPIRRVVFLEQKKFDGRTDRFLRSDEVKQIAGRAGRLGMYDEGYVNAYGGKKQIRKKLKSPDEKIKEAILGFPKALLGIDAKLSDIIKQWTKIPIQEGYRRAVTEREYELCVELEQYCNDKDFIYNCITIAYDEKDADLRMMWREMCRDEWKGKDYPVTRMIPTPAYEDLKGLEQSYRICDLLYAYCDRFGHPQYIPDIQEAKERISERIQKELEKERLQQRTCRRCGQKLRWNYPYGICSECFEATRGRREHEF